MTHEMKCVIGRCQVNKVAGNFGFQARMHLFFSEGKVVLPLSFCLCNNTSTYMMQECKYARRMKQECKNSETLNVAITRVGSEAHHRDAPVVQAGQRRRS